MNCRRFRDAWNERLDAREPGPAAGDDPALAAHEAACAECHALAVGFRTIQQALREPAPAVDLPDGFALRVLAAAGERPTAVVPFLGTARRLVPLAAAAAVLVALTLALRGPGPGPDPRPEPGPAPAAVAHGPAVDPDELALALAEVGTASLSLAREASAPAARLGTDAFEAAGLPGGVAPFGLPVPGVGGGPSLWEGVGGRVSASAGPLAGTARSAFGFLVGVTPEG